MPRGIPNGGRNPARRRKARLDGLNLNLTTPEIQGWVCRWSEDDRRLYQRTQLDDWEFVRPEEIADPETGKPMVGEKTDNPNVDGAGRVRIRVGTREGLPVFQYLIKKRKEFFDADKAERDAEQVKMDEQLKQGISPIEHQHGGVTIT